MNEKINCMIITWNFPPKTGGMENLVYNIYKSTQSFADVLVIAPKSFNNDKNVISPKKFSGLIFFLFFSIYAGIKYSNKGSVIIGGSFLVAPVVLLVGYLKRCKKTCYVHGLDLTYKSKVYQLMLRLFLRRLDHIFANSNNTMNIALDKGFPKNKISIINPFIKDSVFYKIQSCNNSKLLKDSFGLGSKKVLLSVGRLTKRKGLSKFIENCFRFLVEKDDDVVLLISGDDPAESLMHKDGEKAKIIHLINKYDLHKNIKMMGYTDFETLVKMYNICDIFIFPGISVPGDVEGFGMVALEAAAAGKMTIGFDIGGFSDAVEHNVSGVLIPESNYNLMLKNLQIYLNNLNETVVYGDRGRDRVEKYFSSSFFKKKWKKHLLEL
ncbi:MAG: glycosyltransferase family 4 protein [Bacillota bacterium]